jgi:hypothetical protein
VNPPRPWRMLLERDMADVERRLRLHRDTVRRINLGRNPVQPRLSSVVRRVER